MMRLTVSDGLNSVHPFPFRFRIKDVSIHLENNLALNVFPMMQTPITPKHLLVSSSDRSTTRGINFLVNKQPENGRLLYKDEYSG